MVQFFFFFGLGCLLSEYKIKLKINAVPVSNNTHRLPFNLRNKLKCEPNKLEANRIMSEVNELTK